MINSTTTTLKRCSKKMNCVHPEQVDGGWLPATLEYFYKNDNKKTGLCYPCKYCLKNEKKSWSDDKRVKRREISNRYNANHREEINARSREANKQQKVKDRKKRYQKENPERNRQQKNDWYQRNKDAVSQKSREKYENDPEIFNARNKKWIASNPEKKLAQVHRRRAKRLGNGGSYTPEDIQNIKFNQNNRCYYCYSALNKFHIDHVIPLCQGGHNNPSNLVVTCPHCNLSKGKKTLREWTDKMKDEDLKELLERRIREREFIHLLHEG